MLARDSLVPDPNCNKLQDSMSRGCHNIGNKSTARQMNILDLPTRLSRLYDKQLPVMVAATLLVVLVCMSLIALDGWRTWQARGIELHESEVVASNLARSLAQHAEDVIVDADTILHSLVERLEVEGAGRASHDRLYALLSARVAESRSLQGLFVYDETGRSVVNSVASKVPNLNSADREYFIYHRSHDDRNPHIGLSVRSRSTGESIITVSRRINNADGSFAGVALATISLDYFQKFYASFDVGRKGAIVLMLETGAVLVRCPFNAAYIGSNTGSGIPFANFLSKAPVGTAMIKSSVDGVERLNGYRHLEHYPLVVDVALSEDEILDKWLIDASVHSLGVGILIIVLGILGYRVIGQIRLRLRVEGQLAESEKRLRTITDNVPAFIAYIDREQRYRFCNALYSSEFGVPMEELLGNNLLSLFGAEAYAAIAPYVLQALSGQNVVFERHALERGLECHSLYHYVPDIDRSGDVRGFYAMVLDITARKNIELQLSSKEKLLRGLTDHLPSLVSYIDREERFQFNNQAYEEWLGKPLSKITGRHIREACGDAAYFKYKRFLDQAVAGKKIDFAFASKRNGSKRYYNASYIPQFDENGQVVGVCSMTNDITELKKIELQLIKLARIDALTGLSNRAQFDETLRKAIARSRRTGLSMALMYLDIDHFKTINDTYGHQAGDEALCEFARRLSDSVRKTDHVSRLSGDEFVIILECVKAEGQAEIVANKIIQAMEPEFSVLDKRVTVTVSIGIAILREDDIEPETLLHRADQALYRAKSAGRDAYRAAGIA